MMLKHLRDENRCYLMVTTLVSLGLAYFVNKLFSSLNLKKGNLKQIDIEVKEKRTHDLEATTDIKEALNVTECQSDDLKLNSKKDKTLDLLVDRSELDIVPYNESEKNKKTLLLKTSTSQATLPLKTSLGLVTSEKEPLSDSEIGSPETPANDTLSLKMVFNSKLDDLPIDVVSTITLDNLSTETDPTCNLSTEADPAYNLSTEADPTCNLSTEADPPYEFDKLPRKEDPILKHDNTQSEEVSTPNIITLSKVDTIYELDNVQSEEVSTSKVDILPLEMDLTIKLNNLPSEKMSTSITDILPSEVDPSSKLTNLQSGEVSSTKIENIPLEVHPTFKLYNLPSEDLTTSKLQVLTLEANPTSEFKVLSDKVSVSQLELLPSETLPSKYEIFSSRSPKTELELSNTSKTKLKVSPLITASTELEILSSKTQISKLETPDLNLGLSRKNGVKENHEELLLQVPRFQSQPSETVVSSLLSHDSLETLLKESKIASISCTANEILETSPKNSKNLEASMLSHEQDTMKLDTVEFPLDTIPLEMIYQVLPLSMR